MEKIVRIEASNESVLLIGDLNKLVGNEEFGVKHNHSKVSFGGKLIHQLLAGGKFILVNNTEKCEGGPFTRMDPADPTIKSCLDLVLISIYLYDYIVSLKVDEKRLVTPHRPVGRGKKLVYTDHFSLHLIFENIPLKSFNKPVKEKQAVWNTNKAGGWEAYKESTEENDDLINLANEEHLNATEYYKKLENIMNKIKFKCFGKVSFTNKSKVDKPLEDLYAEKKMLSLANESDEQLLNVEERIGKLLLQKQRAEYEKKLSNLQNLKNLKGSSAASFNLKAKILGEKKVRQEAIAIEDPATKSLVFDFEEIKSTSLAYLKNLLTNRSPKEDFKNDIKVVNIIHQIRMIEETKESDDLTHTDFDDLLKNLKKNKMKYNFILKGGASYQTCLFKLFKITWGQEIKPTQWENTIAHQLYKGVGEKSKLSNQRFIHTKEEVPKAFEHLVVSKAKQKIVSGCTKFQIGAIPKHQSQEHLFTLKSIMLWYEELKVPLILQLFDISKFFDRENLQDGMNTLYNCGIKGKLYRLIYELNRKTILKVKTGVGLSKSAELGENITQGSVGGALFSTVNLDYSMNNHFKKSSHEISYSQLRLQPLIFQDDISRLSGNIEDAQAGNIFVESVMESKLLDLNTDKSCYIVIGKKKIVNPIQNQLAVTPLTLCGRNMKEKVSDKYLGDYIHTEGPTASVHCTITNRYGRIMSGILETRAIIDDCRVNTVGGLQSGLDFWELSYLPSLLNNCQTWMNISDNSIKLLEDLQNTMYRVLLNVPRTCPIPALCWELGGVQMKYRVIQKKLNFLWHLDNLEAGTLARVIFAVQRTHNLPGLAQESSELMQNLKLPNILEHKFTKPQWKTLVTKAILKENEGDLKKKTSWAEQSHTRDFL